MRHLGKIGHHRLAADGLAQRQGQRRAGLFIVAAGEHLAQEHGLAHQVGQLDADQIAPGNRGDARCHRRHGTRHIVGQGNHPRRLHPRCRLEFIQCDHRAGTHRGDAALDAEIRQHRFRAGIFLQRLVGRVRVSRIGGGSAVAQCRKLIFARRQVQRRLLVGALGAATLASRRTRCLAPARRVAATELGLAGSSVQVIGALSSSSYHDRRHRRDGRSWIWAS